jgi:hypothetical protein
MYAARFRRCGALRSRGVDLGASADGDDSPLAIPPVVVHPSCAAKRASNPNSTRRTPGY